MIILISKKVGYKAISGSLTIENSRQQVPKASKKGGF